MIVQLYDYTKNTELSTLEGWTIKKIFSQVLWQLYLSAILIWTFLLLVFKSYFSRRLAWPQIPSEDLEILLSQVYPVPHSYWEHKFVSPRPFKITLYCVCLCTNMEARLWRGVSSLIALFHPFIFECVCIVPLHACEDRGQLSEVIFSCCGVWGSDSNHQAVHQMLLPSASSCSSTSCFWERISHWTWSWSQGSSCLSFHSVLGLQVCTAFLHELCGTEGWFSCLLSRHFSVEAEFCRRIFGVTLPKNWVGDYWSKVI